MDWLLFIIVSTALSLLLHLVMRLHYGSVMAPRWQVIAGDIVILLLAVPLLAGGPHG